MDSQVNKWKRKYLRPLSNAHNPCYYQKHDGNNKQVSRSQAVHAIGNVNRIGETGHHNDHDYRVDDKWDVDRYVGNGKEKAMGRIRFPTANYDRAGISVTVDVPAQQHG